MTSYSFPVQAAVYGALKAADAICAGRVYDRPSATVAFPFVEIGEGQAIPDDVSNTAGTPVGDQGISEFIDLHVWSEYQGQKEAKEIIDQIRTALHGISLTVTGRASALAWVRNERIIRDPDGRRTHGVVTVEIIHRNTP